MRRWNMMMVEAGGGGAAAVGEMPMVMFSHTQICCFLPNTHDGIPLPFRRSSLMIVVPTLYLVFGRCAGGLYPRQR